MSLLPLGNPLQKILVSHPPLPTPSPPFPRGERVRVRGERIVHPYAVPLRRPPRNLRPFPGTDFLFRWYRPPAPPSCGTALKMALLPFGNPLQKILVLHPPLPGTDFLFRWYQPPAPPPYGVALKMSLLPFGNPLQKIWYYTPHSQQPLPPFQGGRGSR
jgi:hypothetical protein